MQTIDLLRRRFGEFLGLCGTIAGALTFAVMCLVVANAVMRYGFNRPISGTLELTESALPLMIFLSLALTQFDGGHIRVVVLTQHLPQGLQRGLTVAAMILGAVLFAWAAWAGWNLAMRSLAMHEMERGSIRFPLWPVKFAVFFGLGLLAVQFLIDAIHAALGGTPHTPQAEQQE